jgi:RimJ/RimL family protein N-acetyltransferase
MEDALAVLEWRNDPYAVALSKSGEAIDLDSHLTWFPKALANRDCRLFIAAEDGRRLGMVRFDRCGDAWTVSINLAPAERRKGYGQRMLSKAMADVGGRSLAEIRSDNLASIRLFERCGFRCVKREKGWLQYERP